MTFSVLVCNPTLLTMLALVIWPMLCIAVLAINVSTRAMPVPVMVPAVTDRLLINWLTCAAPATVSTCAKALTLATLLFAYMVWPTLTLLAMLASPLTCRLLCIPRDVI